MRCLHGTDGSVTSAQQPRALPQSERVVRTLLFVDVVESVRLIEANEDDAVLRWRHLAQRVAHDVVPSHQGRLIKRLGDGLMVDFDSVRPAVAAAFAIQRECQRANIGASPDRQMLLRVGAHVTELIADENDVYGRGVNLAARLTSLAGPGEIVVSAAVRDQLTPALDADIEDLGECYLKHVLQPVRAYRVGPPGQRPVIEPGSAVMPELHPTVAVIPFAARSAEPDQMVLGELLADEIIAALSRTAEMNVISRLSTTAFRGRATTLREVAAHLNANYVLSGGYRISGPQLALTAELAEAKSGRIVWSKRIKGKVSGILSGRDEMVHTVVADITAAMTARELQRAQTQPLPTLESYTLLMGAIALLHRLSLQDFDRSRQMLQTLIDRAPRQASPHAWLAKWHVLRVQQGWSNDSELDARLASDCTKRALDADDRCSLALAIDGFVNTNLLKRLDIGMERYDLALSANPNDSLAWLLRGTLHAFKGEGRAAVKDTRHALRLSPLDPLRYFYDSLAATAALAAEHYDRAMELAQRSLRLNRTHTSTLRALAIAQWQLGRRDEARVTVGELMRLDPGLTVSRFVQRSPSSGFATGALWSSVLQAAGVPA